MFKFGPLRTKTGFAMVRTEVLEIGNLAATLQP
jgi:hypothetical protein